VISTKLLAPAICETDTAAKYEPVDTESDVYEAAVTPNESVPVAAAVDGATATRLSPNAATATSAMRLKVVFVDICFLSIVDLENLPSSA